eukprot:scaffold22513_cov57-Attheya_sp.AAC.5
MTTDSFQDMGENPNATPVVVVKRKLPAERRKKKDVKYRKAPQAPKRFKSAYMFFSTAMHPAIRKRLGEKGVTEKTTVVAKLVSQEWKGLSDEKREVWDEKARVDKERYETEKATYTGPWKVSITKRNQKDPTAPKRPMSAFLSYSNSKRSGVRVKNPTLNNTEISRILATMWKDAPEDERKVHIEREAELRRTYKINLANWQDKNHDFNETSASKGLGLERFPLRAGGQNMVQSFDGYGMAPPGQQGSGLLPYEAAQRFYQGSTNFYSQGDQRPPNGMTFPNLQAGFYGAPPGAQGGMYNYGQGGPPLGDAYSHNPSPVGGPGENYGQGEPGQHIPPPESSLYPVEQQEGERVGQYPPSPPSRGPGAGFPGYYNSSYAQYGYGYGPPQHTGTADSAPIGRREEGGYPYGSGGASNNENPRQYPDGSFSDQRSSENPRQFPDDPPYGGRPFP